MGNYVIGLDYGTDSVRAVLINTNNGKEMATAVFYYPRWKKQQYCNAAINQFRQHPLDHIEGLETTIKTVLEKSGVAAKLVKGICIDTTGSSPMPIQKDGTPLALHPDFSENPNAMMVLWKDHTAVTEANQINQLAWNWGGTDYTKYVGGIYSSEWFWAKILHIAKEDKTVVDATYTWMEHCDYMTFMLLEDQNLDQFKRSRCAAGHKAMWHESWGGLPDKSFLEKLDPYLADLKDRLYTDTYTSDVVAGNLSSTWANKLGLTTDTIVTVGTFDAHAGAVGAKIDVYTLVRVMGTSTCDIIIANNETIGTKTVKGICGQVDGSVIPNTLGLEAGQSAFGDVLAWFKSVLIWPIENLVLQSNTLSAQQKEALTKEVEDNFITILSKQAAALSEEEVVPVALDWVNGRRTPDANQELKSALKGLSLGTKAPHLFKALVNAICFGSKMIVDRFEQEGVPIKSVIGIGGVARKSPFIMQTLANVLDRPIKVAASDQAPALGAAVYAATAAGLYKSVIEASKVMGSNFEAEYLPNKEQVSKYALLHKEYEELAKFIETQTKGEN